MTHWFLAESGTDLFFALSGFLIGGMILRKPPTSFADVRRFYMRRWLRTIPLAWVWMTVLVLLYRPPLRAVVENIFMIRYLEIPMQTDGVFFGVMWTLFVEEWFYLLLPIFFVILRISDAPVRRISFLLIGACALRGIATQAGVDPNITYTWTFLRFDVLLAGVLFAAVFEHLSVVTCNRLAFIGVSLIVARWAWTLSPFIGSTLLQHIDHIGGTLGSAAVLGGLYWLRTIPAQRFFFWIATISYPLYLINFEVFDFFYQQQPGTIGAVKAFVFIVIVSYALHRLVESPVISWRDRVLAP
jgi:peptidoglycan/LPS O-acetylase OafA/YrhL